MVAAVSNLTKEGEFTYPALPLLMEYKVVVTTLVTSGRLVSAVVPSTHFNFVFIDEAGQVGFSSVPLRHIIVCRRQLSQRLLSHWLGS